MNLRFIQRDGKRILQVGTSLDRSSPPSFHNRTAWADVPFLFASAGEQVTCEGPEQHLICTVARDILMGELMGNPMPLTDWQQRAPNVGDLLPQVCAKCESAWATAFAGMQIHFKDGWR